MADLHELPKFEDRWTHLYLEYGGLDKDKEGLVFRRAETRTLIPIDQVSLVMLGPGTSVTQQAAKTLATNNCLMCFVGEEGVKMYAFATGGTHSARRLLRQAELYAAPEERERVAQRMYLKRFPSPVATDVTIQQLRGMEGARVRKTYEQMALTYGVKWEGRNYDQGSWYTADPLNRALSSANACLYGLCHAAILSAGYSPAIGFIHTGKMLSFVYDVADLYKTEITIPLAFQIAAESQDHVERTARLACRDMFKKTKLIRRILPDIAEVLDARNDLGEGADELEGRAISLADRAQGWGFPWKSDGQNTG